MGRFSLFLSTLCIVLTLGLKLAFAGWMPYVGWGFGFGLFFFVSALLLNLRYVVSLLKSEAVHFFLQSSFSIVLVAGALFFLNFIVANQRLFVDLTQNQINSLPPLTRALVKALPEDFNFYYFHTGNARVRGFERQVREAMQPYLRLSSKVHLQSFNIFKRPDLAEKFKVGDEESSLFAEFKGRITRISDLDNVAISHALLRLTKSAKKIYFLEAHEERSTSDSSTFGLSGLKSQLERLHFQTESLEEWNEVPEDASILVIIGPQRSFSETDKRKLRDFLNLGGSVFLALDPGVPHGLGSFLAHYGIGWTHRFVFSGQSQANQSDLLVLGHKGSFQHPVTNNLNEGSNPAFFVASAMEIQSQKSGSFLVEPILEYLPDSIVRQDISSTSSKVPEASLFAGLISRGESPDPKFRLVVFADSDFLTNQFYTRPGNFDLALGVLSYLSRDEDLLKLKVPVAQTTYLILTQTQLNLYFIFFILPVSLLFFLVALFFKLRRIF